MNAPYHPLQTMADVMVMIRQSELPERRKRDLLSAIRRVSDMTGCAPASLRVDVPALRKALDEVRPAAHGMSAATFSNIRSLFGAALKWAGLVESFTRGAARRDEQWAPLVAAIAADKRLSAGLASLMNWCAQRSVAPGAVDDEAVQSFLRWLETRTLKPRVRQRVRETVNIWNEARMRIAFWPAQPLTRLSFRPVSANLTWEGLTATFRAEAEAYFALRANPDVFDADPATPKRKLAPNTIGRQREHLRLAASVLVREGALVDATYGLADLVAMDAFKTVLGRYHKQAGGKPNSFVGVLAKTLIDVAGFQVRVPEEHLKELKRIANMLPSVPFDLTEKNKALLRQLESEDLRARLFFLPEDLMRWVTLELQQGRLRAVEAQMAVAVAILLVAPLRPQNLIALNSSRHIKEPHGARGKLVIYVSKGETKTKKRDLTFDLPAELAEPIRWYLREIRPLLSADPGGDLFVSKGGKRKSQETLSQQFTEIIAERIGIHMTPHQFRHFAAFVYLEEHPEDFQSVTDLLGHAWAKTTAIYAGSSGRRASRVYGEHVIEQRRTLGLRRRRRKGPSGPKTTTGRRKAE